MRGELVLTNGVRTDKNRTEAEARRDRFATDATRDTKAAIALSDALFGPMLGGVK